MDEKRKDRRNREALCVYCGRMAISTREHVIPRGFYPKGQRPTDPVIVPACRPCNDRKGVDDSYVRDLFATDLDCAAYCAAKSILAEQVFSSFGKYRSKSGQRAVTSARLEPIYSVGGIYLKQDVAVPVEWKRVKRFFRLVVRGLYWNAFEKRIPNHYFFDIRRVNTGHLVDVLQDFLRYPGHGPFAIGQGACNFTFVTAEEDPFISLWLLCFYERIFITVATMPHVGHFSESSG